MKKLLITAVVSLASVCFASAQVLPNFQAGLKGGLNFFNLSVTNPNFSYSNNPGYLAGVWARIGAVGLNFQPELYFSAKKIGLGGQFAGQSQSLKSLDMPLLVGGKIGFLEFGGRFYAGPVLSYAISKGQTLYDIPDQLSTLKFNTFNYGVTGGIGVDVLKFSLDLRYEYALKSQQFNASQNTKINGVVVSLAYSFLKL